MKESLSLQIDSFLDALTVEKGLAGNTVEAYSRDLNRLAEFLKRRGVKSWRESETIHLRAFLSWLRERKLGARSIARNVVAVRQLFRFLEKEGLIRENPVPPLIHYPAARKLPYVLGRDEVNRLLTQPDPTTALGLRDRAMLELLYASGLRVSELVFLQTHQVNLEANYLAVKGKGSRCDLCRSEKARERACDVI